MSAADSLTSLSDSGSEPPRPGPRSLSQPVSSTSFLCLLAVQFLTVLNDNLFRWLIVPLAQHQFGSAGALSLGLASFTLPFILLATPAGYLADRYSKSQIIRACKLAEIPIMLAGLTAILLGQTSLLLIVVVCTGALAALISPAKSGSIPEQVDEAQLSQANGLMGLVTIVPAAVGFLLARLLQPVSEAAAAAGDVSVTLTALLPAAGTILSVAVLGWIISWRIAPVSAADTTRKYPWNPLGETVVSLKTLASDRPLLRTALGITFFWMLASLAQMNVDQLGKYAQLSPVQVGVLGMMLVLGVGVGSVLAGRWSGGHVELGIVPVGAVAMTFWSVLLGLAGWWGGSLGSAQFPLTCLFLSLLGASAGLFDVPLEAYLQHRADPKQLGLVLSATNFLAFTGILGISGVYYWMVDIQKFSPNFVFMLAGLATIPVAIYIILLLPGATIRFVVWLASHTVYRVRVYGLENVPRHGPALLTPNHVTFIDGILLMINLPRPTRFVIYADFVNNPRLNWLARMYDVIPIKADGGPKSLIQSLKVAREALQDGALVCIFPEGQLTRTGQIQPFAAGMLKILQGTGAPVIPVQLHGLWGSIFSFRGGKFFWKWPRQWPYPVSIMFGKPIAAPKNVHEVRFAVLEEGANAMESAKQGELIPARQFIRSCKKSLKRPRVADSTGVELTGGKLLAGALAFRRVLNRTLAADERHVGILLPSTVGCALANLAVTLSRRVTVNLNYTMSEHDVNYCIRDAGVRHVITSRKFIEKKPFTLDVPFLFLEDLKEQITSMDRLTAGAQAFALPASLVEWSLGLSRVRPDDAITAIYTSGSTGEPKGVLLSQHNIAATIDAANQIFQVTDDDVVLGVVPIFHSLGYLAALWLPMCLTPKVVYHVNPLDAKEVGRLSQEHGVSILFGTPTFLRGYLKRCEKEQFHRLDLVVVGAEKLPQDLAEQFQAKFGVLPSEGYGATETSGPAAVNIPDHRSDAVHQRGTKLGTVGRPLPGVVIRAVDPATRQPLDVNQEGLLMIKGPNVMLGYWNRPEKTAAVIHDGWYDSGDMGFVDEEGFVHITGRISRFSKIGGEMVPHLRIEESLSRICEDPSNTDAGIQVAVTSVPDDKKGERLIVLHKRLAKPVAQVINELAAEGLPNLWIPSSDSFVEVDEIPLLGTGKLDLRGMKQMALDRTRPA